MHRMVDGQIARSVGELIQSLQRFDPDLPIDCHLAGSISVEKAIEVGTGEVEYISLEGIDED